MNYAAAKQFVSPQAVPLPAAEGAVLPWELEGGTAARQETWLLSFIDILALLLTLFVLLLAYQDHRPDRPPRVPTVPREPVLEFPLAGLHTFTDRQVLMPAESADAPGFAMPGEGLLPLRVAGGAELPEPDSASAPADRAPAATPQPAARPPQAADIASEPAASFQTEPASFAVLAEPAPEPAHPAASFPPPGGVSAQLNSVLGQLADSSLAERVEVVVEPGAVSLEISDSILFAPASAALSPAGHVLLADLAGLLQQLPYRLSVEGHTDDVPIRTPRFPSNWELASARAAAVTRRLIELGVSAQRLRAIGYGDTRPRTANDSAAGRARNRRVSFVLAVGA